MFYEYIEIVDIYKKMKKEGKVDSFADLKEITWHGTLLKTFHLKKWNKFVGYEQNFKFFICPLCQKNAKKIFYFREKIGCSTCLYIRQYKRKKGLSRVGQILKIKNNLNKLFDSKRKTTKLLDVIAKDFLALDPKYKMAFNKIMFDSLRDWCADILYNEKNDKSTEYKTAVRDFLGILTRTQKLMVRAKLMEDYKKGV